MIMGTIKNSMQMIHGAYNIQNYQENKELKEGMSGLKTQLEASEASSQKYKDALGNGDPVEISRLKAEILRLKQLKGPIGQEDLVARDEKEMEDLKAFESKRPLSQW